MPPVLKSGGIVSLGEFGEFEEFSGAEVDIATVDHFPSGSNTPIKLQGPHTFTDVTLMRAYDPLRDEPVFDWIRQAMGGTVTPRNGTVMYRNQQGVVLKERSFTAKPKSYTPPAIKSGDGGIAELRIVVSVEGLT